MSGGEWRFIDTGPGDAVMNMAIDESIARRVMAGESPPTLRVYGWEKPSVTIGYFQRLSDVDVEYCTGAGIPVVRRLTGGRAVLHDDEVTYSFSAGEQAHGSFRSLGCSYQSIADAFLQAFREIGLHVEMERRRRRRGGVVRSAHCFEAVSFSEAVAAGRKIMGSAQRRIQKFLLQQGSIPLSVDMVLLERVFSSAVGPIGQLRDLLPGIERAELVEAILRGFEYVFGVRLFRGALTAEEESVAREGLAAHYQEIGRGECRRRPSRGSSR